PPSPADAVADSARVATSATATTERSAGPTLPRARNISVPSWWFRCDQSRGAWAELAPDRGHERRACSVCARVRRAALDHGATDPKSTARLGHAGRGYRAVLVVLSCHFEGYAGASCALLRLHGLVGGPREHGCRRVEVETRHSQRACPRLISVNFSVGRQAGGVSDGAPPRRAGVEPRATCHGERVGRNPGPDTLGRCDDEVDLALVRDDPALRVAKKLEVARTARRAALMQLLG